MSSVTAPPQLCLVVETAAGTREGCAAALNAARIATLILAPPARGSINPEEAAAIITLAHDRNIAVLIEDDVNLAKTLHADGVHLTWREDADVSYAGARAALGPNAIIGVDAGHSRHEAMSLGESGADYVAFGLPGETDDRATAEERRFELIEWWAEVFEVPVVALGVETADEAAPLVDAGADFIAVRLKANVPATQAEDVVSYIAQALEMNQPAT